MGMAAIANAMNDKGWRTRNGASWDERTVWRMLRSEFYIGIVSWGAARATGRHEPIISQELWDQVQAVNAEQQTPVRARHINPLSGLARCGFCGYAMSYGVRENKLKPPYRFMRCSNYVRSFGRDCVPNQRMASRTEQVVLDRVAELLRDPRIYQRAIAAQHDSHDDERLEEIEHDLAECRRQQDRLLSVFVTGDVAREQFEAHNARLQTRIASLEAEYRRLSAWRVAAAATSRQLMALAPMAGALPDLSYEDLNTVYRQVIQRVEVRHREVEVLLRGM
jgi:site-specific DNA recombinase